MRYRRLKLNSEKETAYYHCISRIVGAQNLLKTREKEVLRKQLWLLAEYCGLDIMTYALMSNHYHILLRVPQRREVSDAELLRLHALLYPQLKGGQQQALEAVKADMAVNGPLAERWRRRQLGQMFDVSQFNKLLKMRFSIWYNQTYERIGTLWSERFKSVLIEEGEALKRVAAYIDLNSVRAHVVEDPKDYRFCGYAEAVAGNEKARRGLMILNGGEWTEASTDHRCMMFALLSEMREQKAKLDPERWEELVKSGGKLPLSVVLRSRIRYFVDGVILGSEAYVKEKAGGLAGKDWKPKPLAAVTDWAGLHVFSGMRTRLWG